jgi:hexosaminidase
MRLCSEGIALALEDDAPASGARAIFHVDIQNPCWILPQLDLSVPTTLVAEVGSVPFNFQIGADAAKIRFDAPSTAEGELLLRLDDCEGEPVLRVPLGVAAGEDAVATLPAAVLPVRAGHHDLCLRFSQPRLDPIRTLDAVRLSTAEAR